MSGTVRARFKAGVLELLDAVDLSEGAEVSVTIMSLLPRMETTVRACVMCSRQPQALGKT
jgi:predicted DNA-binding antitoxin AbrB/MazE fold protein